MNATQSYASAAQQHHYIDASHNMSAHGPAQAGMHPYGHYNHPPPSQPHSQPMMPPAMSYPPYAAYPGYHASPATHPPMHPMHQYSTHPHQVSAMSQMPPNQPQSAPQPHSQPQQQARHMDTTGQVHPTGLKPKMTGTVWEDEGTVCFQVEVNGICVARREDNCFINGTKLLNVANMTRGRRDGILKSEKVRNVVKIGPMHLKGVWIPFDRALEFANKEKITESLYPLFLHEISHLMSGQIGNTNSMASRRSDSNTNNTTTQSQQQGQSSSPQYQRTPQSAGGATQHSVHTPVSQAQAASTALSRAGAHAVPTPPASATSAGLSHSYDWGNPHPGESLQVDTHFNPKSLPATPTTTPPDHLSSNLHYTSGPTYESSRAVYSAPAAHHAQYPSEMAQYGQMQPPRAHYKTEDLDDHNKGYGYPAGYPVDEVKYEREMAARAPQTPQSQWGPGSVYSTPQRSLPSTGLTFGGSAPVDSRANGYIAAPAPYGGGSVAGSKRGREPDDDGSADLAAMKRRKSTRDDPTEPPRNAYAAAV